MPAGLTGRSRAPAPARHRRGQGPAHPARARDRRRASRRWSSPSACWRWPGATPRYQGPRPGGRPARVARAASSTTRGSSGRCGSLGLAVLRLPDLGADLGTRPGHQPGARHVLRAGLGRHRAGLAAVRAGRQGSQPGAHAQPAAGQGHRRRPGDRPVRRTPPGSATGRPPLGLFAFVWQELVNPQSAYLGLGAALAGGVPRDHADRRRGLRRRVARAGRPVRGVLQPARPAVRLGPRRTTGSSYAARWRTSPPSSRRPGLVAVVAVLFGSTAFDTYKDTIPWQRFVHRRRASTTIFTNTVALLGFCLVVGVTFTVAAMSTGVETTGPDAVRRRTCRTCSPTRWSRSSSAT